jgi:hypothetical protein
MKMKSLVDSFIHSGALQDGNAREIGNETVHSEGTDEFPFGGRESDGVKIVTWMRLLRVRTRHVRRLRPASYKRQIVQVDEVAWRETWQRWLGLTV